MLEELPQWLIELLPFIAIGFAAQLVDGALGMAFGVITQTMLVGVLGVPPATASASVHFVEVFTTGASGSSHLWRRNIDWKLFRRLVPAGVIAGASGAYVLSNVDASVARPFVLVYLVAIGLYLLVKAIRFGRKPREDRPRLIAPLAIVGGFLDSAGGGGWGPIVTSNLLVQGSDPRTTIGTVNASEFLLTLTVSIAFALTLGLAAFTNVVVGLIIGGVIAAPFGAILVSRIPPRPLLLAVALVLIATSAFGLWAFAIAT